MSKPLSLATSDRLSILLIWLASMVFALFVDPNHEMKSVRELLYYSVYNVAIGWFAGFYLFDRLARESLRSFAILTCVAIGSGTLVNEALIEYRFFGTGPINFEGFYYGVFEAATTGTIFLLLRLAGLLRAWSREAGEPAANLSPRAGLGSAPERSGEGAFFVRIGGGTRRIHGAEVIYMRAERDFTHIVCSSGKYFASESLKELLEKSAPYGVVRVHKSFAVNLSRVEWLTRTQAGLGDHRLPVGRRYCDRLADAWRQRRTPASGPLEVPR